MTGSCECLRIIADADGQTHMLDIRIGLQPKQLFKNNPPLRLTDNLPASWYNICHVPALSSEGGGHHMLTRIPGYLIAGLTLASLAHSVGKSWAQFARNDCTI